MAGFRKVKQQCDRQNDTRNVETVHTMDAERFWNFADGKTVLITGSSLRERQAQLAVHLMKLRQRSRETIIILAGSADTEQLLIPLAQANRLGRLAVCSPEYPNYELLYHVESSKVADVFTELVKQNESSSEMQFYEEAFLNILSQEYPISLSTILMLSRYSDAELAAFGRASGAAQDSIHNIEQYPEAGKRFRSIAERMFRAASRITTRDCDSHINCLQAVLQGEPLTLVVRIQSDYPEVLYACLAAELDTLAADGHHFHIVLSEVALQENEVMIRLLQTMTEYSEIGVTISVPNIITWSKSLGEHMLKTAQSIVLLNDGHWNTQSLNEILNSFGAYNHFESTLTKGNPPRLLPVLADEHWSMAPIKKPRVCAADMEHISGLFYGHNGGYLVLAKNIRFSPVQAQSILARFSRFLLKA